MGEIWYNIDRYYICISMGIIAGKEKRNKLNVQEKSACDEEIMGKEETVLEWYRKEHKFKEEAISLCEKILEDFRNNKKWKKTL